jgi:hypothetical protein
MKTVRACSDCAIWNALEKAYGKSGKFERPDPSKCQICHGSGQVEVDTPWQGKVSRKYLSGTEWLAEDERFEWDYYVTFEKPIE